MVTKLNNDSSMGQYYNMCVIPRKVFQKMLNYIWWLSFQTCRVIMANYHTRLESKFCMYPCSAGGQKSVFKSTISWIFGLICSNYWNSTQFVRLITRRKKKRIYDCKYMKTIYVTQLRSSSENKTWKISRPVQDFNPWPLQYRHSALR